MKGREIVKWRTCHAKLLTIGRVVKGWLAIAKLKPLSLLISLF